MDVSVVSRNFIWPLGWIMTIVAESKYNQLGFKPLILQVCVFTSLCMSNLTRNAVAVCILQCKFLMPHLSSAQQGLA